MGYLDLLDRPNAEGWREKLERAFPDPRRSEPTKSTESLTQTTLDEACRLLNEVEARLWLDSAGNGYVGVWSCVDSNAVRRAAALVFPDAKLIHLERPEVPLSLKEMSKKIWSIEDAKRT